jgi:hypothetical protein
MEAEEHMGPQFLGGLSLSHCVYRGSKCIVICFETRVPYLQEALEIEWRVPCISSTS